MIMSEWADALANIADDSERRDCLLILADSMRSELGAQVLRELASRKEGLCPELTAQRKGNDDVDRWDWNAASRSRLNTDEPAHSRIADATLALVPITTFKTLLPCMPHFRAYCTPGEAWLALLEALDAYEETNDG